MEFGILNLLGIWILGFGIYFRPVRIMGGARLPPVPLHNLPPRGEPMSGDRRSSQTPRLPSARRPASEAGITLIELLVVVTIIALFAALVGPRLFKHVGKSRAVAAHAQIESFQTALGAYKLDTGTFPTTQQGLEALRTKPADVQRWDGPYLPQDIPFDPWGHPYVYKFPGDHGDEPDIISLGADGRPGGEGEDADILSWTSRKTPSQTQQ